MSILIVDSESLSVKRQCEFCAGLGYAPGAGPEECAGCGGRGVVPVSPGDAPALLRGLARRADARLPGPGPLAHRLAAWRQYQGAA